MQRFRVFLWPLLVMALMAVVAGCQHGEVPSETEAEDRAAAMDAQQQKLLEDLIKYQRETGSTLDSLAKEIARREAVESQAVGPSPLQRDLAVARALLVTTRRAVHAEDFEEAQEALRRLEAVVDVMQGETPAARIITLLERAGLALQGSAAGVEADVASACLLGALDVALKSDDAPLVPEIAQKIEKTKAQVDKGDYKDALKSIEGLIPALAGHEAVRLLKQAEAGVLGAREAMRREAGLVVLAELDQLSDLFNRFATMLKAAPAKPAEEEEEEDKAEAAPEPEAARLRERAPAPEVEAGEGDEQAPAEEEQAPARTPRGRGR